MVDTDVAQQAARVPRRPKGKAARATAASRWDRLFHWSELPEYLRDNEYIFTGYRVQTGVWGSFKSLFRIHNESGNVWTHLIGFFLFFCLLLYVIQAPPTPLALRKEDANRMWDSIASRLRTTSSALLQHTSKKADVCEVHDIHQAAWLKRDVSGRNLQDSLMDAVHRFESQLQHLPAMVSDKLHILCDAIMHPKDELRRISGLCQKSFTAGVQNLRDGFEQSLANVRSSMSGGLRNVSREAAALPAEMQHAAEILESWLHMVVQKSVHWPVVRWPMYVYMAGAMNCLLLSAMCHLLGSSNKDYFSTIWRFDYAGIVGMIVTSFYPSVYYVFLCDSAPRWIYLGGVTTFGGITFILSLLNRFQTTKWRATRAICFSLLGMFGLVPWGHVVWQKVYLHPAVSRVMQLDAVMATCYVVGAAVYANRVPEKWFPGKFDLFFHSHQIFHIFVVVAAYAHFLGVLELLAWRDASGGCAVDTSNTSVHSGGGRDYDTYDVDELLCFFQVQIPTLWNDQQ